MANTVLEQLQGIQSHLNEIREQQEQAKIERGREQEKLRGVKPGFRLPVIEATGTTTFSAGGDIGQVLQKPDEGFVWYLRHLVITGLTLGATPDRVQVLRAGEVIWELNGNQYAQTWGKSDIKINPGESLSYRTPPGVNFASTAQIRISGAVDEYPGPQAGKAVQ